MTISTGVLMFDDGFIAGSGFMRGNRMFAAFASLLLGAFLLTGCGSDSDSEAEPESDPAVAECTGIADGDCEALRRIEADVPLVDFGDDPCSLGFEYDDEGFDGLGVACEDGRVVKLGLHAAGLTDIPAGMFSGLDGLLALSVGGNKIAAIDSTAFTDIPQLHDLFLFENELTELPGDLLSELIELRIFTVERNNLTEVPEELFAGNPQLEIAQINANELTEVPAGLFAGVENLTTIYMGNNEISTIDSGLFSDLPNLVDLVMSSNKIESFPTGLFASNTKLVSLGLNSNGATFSDGVFGETERSIESLNVKCNGPLPADFALISVTDELVIDADQQAQADLSVWISESPAEVETNC